MRSITVYSTGPDCQKCTATKRWLDRRGIPYIEIDVRHDPEDLARARAYGYTQSPVVVVSDEQGREIHWPEFNPILLDKYTGQVAA